MSNNYTEDLSDFGFREIKLLSELLNAWVEQGLPDNFGTTGVKPAMNKMSGILDLAEAAAYDLPQSWLTLHIDRILADE